MRIILNKNELATLWCQINEMCDFCTRIKDKSYNTPFNFKEKYVKYKASYYWHEKENRLVNDLLGEMGDESLYALVYNHDSFEFNPNEEFLSNKYWYDTERDVNVYFPSYYPDGDYHFFVSKDFTYGLFGVPFRNEIYAVNNKLITQISKKTEALGLVLL